MTIINNNVRIQRILEGRLLIEKLARSYLSSLKRQYDYKNNVKSIYGSTKVAMVKIRKEARDALVIVRRRNRSIAKNDEYIKREALNLLQRMKDDGESTRELATTLAATEKHLREDEAHEILRILDDKEYAKLKRVRLTKGLLTVIELGDPQLNKEEVLETFLSTSMEISSTYLKNQNNFRSSLESGDLVQALKNLRDQLEDNKIGYFAVIDDVMSRISDALFEQPLKNTARIETSIQEEIHSQRSYQYRITRGYTVLPYSDAVYSAMDRIISTIGRGGQYVGMKNAFDNYYHSVDRLERYYYERYEQVGGEPRNLHGHSAAKF